MLSFPLMLLIFLISLRPEDEITLELPIDLHQLVGEPFSYVCLYPKQGTLTLEEEYRLEVIREISYMYASLLPSYFGFITQINAVHIPHKIPMPGIRDEDYVHLWASFGVYREISHDEAMSVIELIYSHFIGIEKGRIVVSTHLWPLDENYHQNSWSKQFRYSNQGL